MLSAEGLRHAFGTGGERVVALDNVSFSLEAGQTLAIFGPNGAGKTTLLKVLAGLIPPHAGGGTGAGGGGGVGWVGHPTPLYRPPTRRRKPLFLGGPVCRPGALRRRPRRRVGDTQRGGGRRARHRRGIPAAWPVRALRSPGRAWAGADRRRVPSRGGGEGGGGGGR